MKYLLLLLVVIMSGCGDKQYDITYMKAPVILIAKDCSWDGCNIVLMECDGVYTTFGTASPFGNAIANSYEVGDTIKHVNNNTCE